MRLDEEMRELRKEVSQFRVETRQRLEVIENEVNKQVSLNYNRAVVDHLASTTIELIDSLKCGEANEMELDCKKMMANAQQGYLRLLKDGRVTEALEAMDEAILVMDKVSQGMRDRGKPGCVECMESEIGVIESNKRMLSHLQMLESPAIALGEQRQTVGRIDPPSLHEEILNPLSNKARVQILVSIYEGRNRFADLVEATGQRGGHLLYHLRMLMDNGFVNQFASKEYVLTKKGLKTLIVLAQLSGEIS